MSCSASGRSDPQWVSRGRVIVNLNSFPFNPTTMQFLSVPGMIGSILMVILIAVLHEAIIGLRFFLDREILLSSAAAHNSQASSHRSRESLVYVNEPANNTQRTGQSTASSDSQAGAARILLRHLKRVFSGQRMLQALLYAIQWTLFFILILIVVTFNVWLIVYVVYLYIYSPIRRRRFISGQPSGARPSAISSSSARPQWRGSRGCRLGLGAQVMRGAQSC